MILYLITTLLSVIIVYILIVRPLLIYWGATTEEIYAALPGDEYISSPEINTTKAVLVNAKPAEIWPWIVQMGQGRGGHYSYDWLENLFGFQMNSVLEILPEMQHLKAGDTVNFSAGRKMVADKIAHEKYVLLLEHDDQQKKSEKTSHPLASWLIYLQLLENGDTHVISHIRYAYRPGILYFLKMRLFIELAGFIMERRMLLGIKERAEYVKNMLSRVPHLSR